MRGRKKCEAQKIKEKNREALEASREIDIYVLGFDALG